MIKESLLVKHPILVNIILSGVAGLLGYMKVIVFENINMFVAILFVVIFDFVFGVAKAIKYNKFRTRRAMKVVYYLSSYWAILFVVLTIEKAHQSAFWISEAVFLPIILFQFISALKNASIVGAIPQGVLLKILESIDKHKDRTFEQLGDMVTDSQNNNQNQETTNNGSDNTAADSDAAPGSKG